MDYSGLINLALVTILYSTFIAPSLKILGAVRDEIANTQFPIKDLDDTEPYSVKTKEVGAEMSQKMTQYADKYDEIKNFLKYFYAILIVILVVQVCYMALTNNLTVTSITSLLGAVLVIMILIVTVNKYMLKPWKVRSIGWLATRGIAPVHVNEIFNPRLVLNRVANNVVDNDGKTHISLVSDIKLLGFGFVVLLESEDFQRLYMMSAGKAKDNLLASPLIYHDGRIEYEARLGNVSLQPGKYNARLLLFAAPFQGRWDVIETILPFEIDKNKNTSNPKTKKIDLSLQDSNYSYDIKKGKITNINYEKSFKNEKNIVALFSSKRFLKLLNSLSRPYYIESRNGTLDKMVFNRSFTRRAVLRSWLRRVAKRTTYYKLKSE